MQVKTDNNRLCFFTPLQVGKKLGIFAQMTLYIKENMRCECLQCGKVSFGRPDKKFCSEVCKNAWHNARQQKSRQLRNRILTALNKNYRILEELISSGRLSAELMPLEERGFRPSFVTGYTRVRYGHDVFRCFDISYSLTGARLFRIRKDSDD